jgi:hypothetical protein
MTFPVSNISERAVRRAAPKPARIPSGDRLRYTADKGLTS